MFTLPQLKELTDNPNFHKFAGFILSSLDGRKFPDYKKLDLMKIPSLVPNIWVLDFKEIQTKGCRLHFSGTEVDKNYDRNVTGQYLEKLYSGNDYVQLVEEQYRNVYFKKMSSYTRRSVHFHDGFVDKYRLIESLLVPCSNDGETINFGLGLAFYNVTSQSIENHYTWL